MRSAPRRTVDATPENATMAIAGAGNEWTGKPARTHRAYSTD